MEHKMGVMAYVLMNLILLGIPLKLFGIELCKSTFHLVCHRIRNASVLEKIWWKEVDNMDWAYWLANNGNVLDEK